VVLVGALALMWIYALFVANPANTVDKLNEPSFPRAAQPVCANTLDEFRRLDLVNKVAASPVERAALVDKADAQLVVMLQRLRTLVPAPGQDATAVTKWLDDWDQWLRDRATWSEKLHRNEDAPFLEKQRDTRQPNSKALDDFARTNEMRACTTPAGV
jgi:hypothetical protein